MADRPNPTVRRSGLVLLGLAVLAYISAITGFDAHGTTGRIIFAVVGTVLLLFGLPLLRVRTPAVAALRADSAGLHVTVAGHPPAVVAWSAMRAIWLHQLSRYLGGHVLNVEYADGAQHSPGLRPFEIRRPDGRTRLMIGLDRAQAAALAGELPAVAGPVLRTPPPTG